MFFDASEQLAQRLPDLRHEIVAVDGLLARIPKGGVLTLRAASERLPALDEYQVDVILRELADMGLIAHEVQYVCAACDTTNSLPRTNCSCCSEPVNIASGASVYTQLQSAAPKIKVHDGAVAAIAAPTLSSTNGERIEGVSLHGRSAATLQTYVRLEDVEYIRSEVVHPAWLAAGSRPLTNDNLDQINRAMHELLQETHWSFRDRSFLEKIRELSVREASKRVLSKDHLSKLLELLDSSLLQRKTSEADEQSTSAKVSGPEVASGYRSVPTIGVLTALPTECAAMRLMFDSESRSKAPGEGGGREYYLGTIASSHGTAHVVALALLPDMGNNTAAVSATRLLLHFGSVRHIIMCGIAGGVPRPGHAEHDVRLGDIVVSNRNGVIQYEVIKEQPDGSREHRHPPRPPGAELLGAVRHLQTEELLRRRAWEPLLDRGALMEAGTRPSDEVDAEGRLIQYPADPRRTAGLPRVFHAAIAAANTLLKNPEHRDYLATTFGVKAIEMEGAGVADATWIDGAGYLVVRGICDYCDGGKGDFWQGSAAIAAAAYVRAVISSMLPEAST